MHYLNFNDMKVFYKIPAIIYRTYDDRGAHSPYFDAILTMIIILFFHAVHIGLLFNIPSDYIMPWSSKASRPMQWFYGTLYFGVIITVISIIFRKSKLEKVVVSQTQIDRGRSILPIYLASCLILLLVLLIKSGVEKGKINL